MITVLTAQATPNEHLQEILMKAGNSCQISGIWLTQWCLSLRELKGTESHAWETNVQLGDPGGNQRRLMVETSNFLINVKVCERERMWAACTAAFLMTIDGLQRWRSLTSNWLQRSNYRWFCGQCACVCVFRVLALLHVNVRGSPSVGRDNKTPIIMRLMPASSLLLCKC